MNVRRKYFVFNKESDYRRGSLENLSYRDGCLCIADEASGKSGVFFSRLLDSRENGAVWHRMTVDSLSFGDASIRFTFYASEKKSFQAEGRQWDLPELLQSVEISASEKTRLFQPFFVKSVLNPKDLLLTEAEGQYLWFRAELFTQEDESPGIRKIRIALQTDPWSSYLPEIYQDEGSGRSFTNRFLSIFQSLYDDLDERLDMISGSFDAEVADYEVLQWLASWIGIKESYLWSEKQLRYLVVNSQRMFRQRGTRKSVEEMVELYTGQKPFIVEQYQIERYREDDAIYHLMHQLYGEHAYQFTVIVDEKCVPSTKEFRTLTKIIESVKPAGVDVNLVVLKPYIFLSKYSYIGVNSYLGQYRTAGLDGFSTLPFTNITASLEERDAVNERKGESK